MKILQQHFLILISYSLFFFSSTCFFLFFSPLFFSSTHVFFPFSLSSLLTFLFAFLLYQTTTLSTLDSKTYQKPKALKLSLSLSLSQRLLTDDKGQKDNLLNRHSHILVLRLSSPSRLRWVSFASFFSFFFLLLLFLFFYFSFFFCSNLISFKIVI